MFRGKIWKKLLITFLMVTLIIFLLINYPMKYWLFDKEEERIKKEIQKASGDCEELLRAADDEEKAFAELARYSSFFDKRVMVVDAAGIVKMDTRKENVGRDVYKVFPGLKIKYYARTRLEKLLEETSSVSVSDIRGVNEDYSIMIVAYDNNNLNDRVEEGVYRFNILGLVFTGMALIVFFVYGIF